MDLIHGSVDLEFMDRDDELQFLIKYYLFSYMTNEGVQTLMNRGKMKLNR